MIKNEHMFNYETLNIFTDASILKMSNGETIGCAGANVINGPSPLMNVLEQDMRIIRRSTSNNSEIQAVKLGIEKALKYRNNYKTVNLISDSKISIYGLREWIFNWIINSGNSARLIGSTNKEVANQHIILQIIYMILDNDLRINFYYQNGHVVISNDDSLLESKKLFIELNNLRHDVDIELIKNISIANNAIDKLTRNTLKSSQFGESYSTPMMRYIYNPFDVDKYSKLINSRR
jgi:ribonuclease HI